MIKEGTRGEAVYFLQSGVFEIWSKYNEVGPVNLVSDGSYVGDVSVLLSTEASPVKTTATVNTFGKKRTCG